MPKNDLQSVLPAGTLAVVAEFVSTGLLILMGCMSCTSFSGIGPPNILQTVLAFGLAVMFNIQIFGHVSGAHMNPCVTLACVLLRKMSPLLGLGYVIAQCAGAIAGYGLLMLVMPSTQENTCVTFLHVDVTPLQGVLVEVSLTLVLVLLVCAFWDPVHKNTTDSLAIKFGLTITGLCLAGGNYTGASLNPARSLGPAVWNNAWKDHWVFWVGPLLSGVIGAFMYKFLFHSRPAPLTTDPAEEVPLSVQEKGAGGAA